MADNVSRRDILKLAGMATAGMALASCGVPQADPTPTTSPSPTALPAATPLPTASVVADVPLNSGPADLGFEQLAVLERGMTASPLERFGDFVHVVSQVEDTGVDGWVPAECLDELPEGLRELKPEEVPWVPQRVVSPESPFVMQSEKDEYDGTSLYGSAIEAGRELRLDFSIKITVPDGAERANGIVLVDSLENPHRLFFGHSLGQWRLAAWDQGSPKLDHLMSASDITQGRAWLHVSEDGDLLRYGLPDGTEGEVKGARAFFTPNGILRAQVQLAPRSTVELSELTVSYPPSGRRESDPARAESLGELALARGLTFGSPTDADEPRSERVFARQAGLLTWNLSWRAETELYPGFTPGTANQVSFAKANGMRVRAHPLVGGPSDLVPDWLKNGGHTAEEVEGFTREWVTGMVSRYTAVDEWVVVNESLGGGAQLDNNIWNRTMGVAYIDKSFRWARKANPDTALLINEAEVDRPGARLTFYYELVRRLLDGGMPLDGVGSQFHLKAVNAPSKDELLEAFDLLGGLGVGVYVTELDVNLYGLRGTQEEKWARQAEIYRDVVEAALESGVVRSLTTWGLSDRYSWLLLPEFQFLGGGEAPLIFDEEYMPKPAFYAMRDALRGN